jgi:Phage tail sheath C-terminal domain
MGESESVILIQRGINPLRSFPSAGLLVWGARTTRQDPEWKYINIRRIMIFIERSIDHDLQWAVFEPNSPTLWSAVSTAIQDFLFTVMETRLSEWHNAAEGLLCPSRPEHHDSGRDGRGTRRRLRRGLRPWCPPSSSFCACSAKTAPTPSSRFQPQTVPKRSCLTLAAPVKLIP